MSSAMIMQAAKFLRIYANMAISIKVSFYAATPEQLSAIYSVIKVKQTFVASGLVDQMRQQKDQVYGRC